MPQNNQITADYAGPRTDAEQRHYDETQARWAREDARIQLSIICENVGKQLPGYAFDADDIEEVSDAICNRLYYHPDFKAILEDGPATDGYDIAAEAMKRGAGIKTEEAA
jgi:hypothetical protein